MRSTYSEHYEFQPFVWGKRKSLDISSWDRKEEGLIVLEKDIDFVHHKD
jgi:hypothetical protein